MSARPPSQIQPLAGEEPLGRLAGTVADIPRRGIGWTWKRKVDADASGAGAASAMPALTGSAQGSAKILRGPGYSFRGALKGIVGLKSPLPFGSASSKAERSRRSTLRVDFAHPGGMRVIDAACLDLPVISRLDDPVALLKAEAFRKATLEFSGAVRLGAEFRVANTLAGSLGVGGAPVSQTLRTRLRYAVDWTREGRFRLGIRRTRGGRLRLRLTDARKAGNRRSLSMGAEVRIRGLREAVAPAMRRIARLPEGLEELAGKYSQPSGIFERKFKEKMKSLDAPAQALLNAVAGSRSADELADELAGAIVEVARSGAKNWTEMLEGKVDGVVEKALAEIEVARDRELAGEAAALVKRKAREALDALNGEMQEQLAAAVLAQGGAGAIAAALAPFAEAVEEAAEGMDAAAAALTAPFRKLLAHYRATEEHLRNAVEAVEKGKLAVKFSRLASREKRTQALLVFDLDPSDAQAAELYRKMLAGDFRAAMAAASGGPGANGAITLRTSVFKRVFDDRETSGVTFNLFGLETSSKRKLAAKIRVEHDFGGQINVFEAEGSVAEETAAFGEGQSMRVDSLLNFLANPDADSAGADSADALAVQLNYTDANMTAGELREYAQSLEDAGLIAEGAALRLADGHAGFGGGDGGSDGGKRLMRIDTRFALTRAAFRKIGEAHEERIIRVAIRQQLRAYNRMDWAAQSLGLLAGLLGDAGTVEQRIYELRGVGRRLLEEKIGLVRSEQARKIKGLVWSIADRAEALAAFAGRWRQLNGLRLALDQRGGAADEKLLAEARALHSDMLADLRSWTDARGPLVGLAREDLSPVAAAFLASLRELSGQRAEPLIPILTCAINGQSEHTAIA